ncbi:MAG: hypothetical protein QOE70_4019 [Chthoniobacter sp.]|jgi:hypothetical protein|nr:hypothetical protein [Chthoniobacter sp.]
MKNKPVTYSKKSEKHSWRNVSAKRETTVDCINRTLRIGEACGVVPATLESLSLAFADTIGNVICNRINFPKAAGKAKSWDEVKGTKGAPKRGARKPKTVTLRAETALSDAVTTKASIARRERKETGLRPLLNEQEIDDVKQAVCFALIATGAFEARSMVVNAREPFAIWKACFQAARGKDCLRIDRKIGSGNECFSIDAQSDAQLALLSAQLSLGTFNKRPALIGVKRARMAREIAYLRSLCFAAYRQEEREGKRNRVSNLRKALAFVHFLASQYTAKGGKGIADIINTESAEADAMLIALRMRKKRFVDYTEKAEALLTAEAFALAPLELPSGEFHSFAQLCGVSD